MRAIWAPAVLVVAFSCCACTSNIDFDAEMQSLRVAKPCCSTLQGQSFQPLKTGDTVKFSIESTSPAFDFGPHGLSYFAAFELPELGSGNQLVVRANGIGANLNSQPCCVFFPIISLYDADLRPLAESRLDQTRYHNNLSTLGDASVAIDVVPGTRYAVVHTSRPLLDRGARPWANFIQGHAAPGIVWDTMDRAELRAAPVSGKGNMEIRIEPKSDSMWKGASYPYQGF
jgi:hypothetical protein